MLAGAVVGEAFFRSKLGRAAPIVGAAAALVPDLDVVGILVAGDPLEDLWFHRTWSHSFLALPVLAAAVAVAAWLVLRRRRGFDWVLLLSAGAMATHALLDVATNYGMTPLWPLSNRRYALDWLPFIDPYLVALLLVPLILCWRRLRRGLDGHGVIRRGAAAAAIYVLMLGSLHHVAVGRLQRELGERGHTRGDVGSVACMPVPVVPLAWNAFFTTDDGREVQVGLLWVLRQGTTRFQTLRSDGPSAAIEAFRRSPDGRSWLEFARFPVLGEVRRDDGSAIVHGWDARFQTWLPVLGWKKAFGSAIHAEVSPDGRVTSVRLGGRE